MIEKINDGIKNRSNALSFVGAILIHKAVHDHANVLNKRGKIMEFPIEEGVKTAINVIAK